MNPTKPNPMTKMATPGTATVDTRSPEILGIRVVYDPRMVLISDSRGLWPCKKIVIGPAFLRLSDRQKGAVLLHEAGHCKLFHTERIVLYTLLRPRLIWALISASIAASRKFASETAESITWFQSEIERRAPGIGSYRQALESQADRFASGCGYGPDLAQVLLSPAGGGGPFHPSPMARAQALFAMEPRP